VPLGTLAFKSQGSRVPGCVPGCRPAGSQVIRLAEGEADRNRLLHGCYTPGTLVISSFGYSSQTAGPVS